MTPQQPDTIKALPFMATHSLISFGTTEKASNLSNFQKIQLFLDKLRPDSKRIRLIAIILMIFNICVYILAIHIYVNVIGIALVVGDSLPIHLTPLLRNNILADGKYLRNVDVDGYSGHPIADVRDLYDIHYSKLVRNGYYKGVILFYDSDVSNYDESVMTTSEITTLRTAYENSLVSLVQSIKPFAKLALASPALLSDGNYTRMIANFGANKTQMLNDYANINKRICTEQSIEYIDIRSAYLESLRNGNDPAEIEDGEHPNALGQEIAGRLFTDVLDRWWKQ
jgi:hypothetical protein